MKQFIADYKEQLALTGTKTTLGLVDIVKTHGHESFPLLKKSSPDYIAVKAIGEQWTKIPATWGDVRIWLGY